VEFPLSRLLHVRLVGTLLLTSPSLLAGKPRVKGCWRAVTPFGDSYVSFSLPDVLSGGLPRHHLSSGRVWEGQRGFSGIDSPSLEAQFGEDNKEGVSKEAFVSLSVPSCVCSGEMTLAAPWGPARGCLFRFTVGRSPERGKASFPFRVPFPDLTF